MCDNSVFKKSSDFVVVSAQSTKQAYFVLSLQTDSFVYGIIPPGAIESFRMSDSETKMSTEKPPADPPDPNANLANEPKIEVKKEYVPEKYQDEKMGTITTDSSGEDGDWSKIEIKRKNSIKRKSTDELNSPSTKRSCKLNMISCHR